MIYLYQPLHGDPLRLPWGARVRVINRTGELVRVEDLSGKYRGTCSIRFLNPMR